MFDLPDENRDTFLYQLERDSEVQKLIAYLKRGEKDYVRRRAATILGNISTIQNPDDEQQAIDALINTVEEDEAEAVRAAAVDALYQRGEDALAQLFATLATTDSSASDGDPGREQIREWITADRPEFRMVAATAVGRLGATDLLPALLAVLNDPDARVRVRAARACGTLGHPGAVDALIDRLDDDRDVVQEAAANALGSIGTDEALKALVPLTRAESQSLRLIAVDELGQFGSLEPALVLVDALDDASSSVQRAAMLSLLELCASSDPEQTTMIRRTIAKQLRDTDIETAVPTLLDIARDSNRKRFRQTALWLLGQVTDDDYHNDVVEFLIDTLDSGSEERARIAASGLLHLRGPEVEKQLRMYLQRDDTDEEGRERASRVLDEICDGDGGELVRTSVNYTYVRNPSDYTAQYGNGE